MRLGRRTLLDQLTHGDAHGLGPADLRARLQFRKGRVVSLTAASESPM
jgi:hypothetical protein